MFAVCKLLSHKMLESTQVKTRSCRFLSYATMLSKDAASSFCDLEPKRQVKHRLRLLLLAKMIIVGGHLRIFSVFFRIFGGQPGVGDLVFVRDVFVFPGSRGFWVLYHPRRIAKLNRVLRVSGTFWGVFRTFRFSFRFGINNCSGQFRFAEVLP